MNHFRGYKSSEVKEVSFLDCVIFCSDFFINTVVILRKWIDYLDNRRALLLLNQHWTILRQHSIHVWKQWINKSQPLIKVDFISFHSNRSHLKILELQAYSKLPPARKVKTHHRVWLCHFSRCLGCPKITCIGSVKQKENVRFVFNGWINWADLGTSDNVWHWKVKRVILVQLLSRLATSKPRNKLYENIRKICLEEFILFISV